MDNDTYILEENEKDLSDYYKSRASSYLGDNNQAESESVQYVDKFSKVSD